MIEITHRINKLLWPMMMGLALLCTDAHAGDKVRIIIRAFIPSSLPGATDILPVPNDPQKFMLSGPGGTCFDTDNRTFSNDPAASARIATDFTVEVTDPAVITPAQKADRFRSGISRKLNCKTGAVEATGQASVGGCTMGAVSRTDQEVQVITACSVGNPLLVAPTIDYGGSFIYNFKKSTLSFVGDVGAFPAFEILASVNGGKFFSLLKKQPSDGAGPFRLFDLWLHINTKHIVIPPTKIVAG